MPELPEAETVARELSRHLVGRALGIVRAVREDVVHGDPRPLASLLPGRRVAAVLRRAKRVLVELDPPATMVFHMGMSGRVLVCPARRKPAAHTHLRVAIRGTGRELRFIDPRRFGGIWLLGGGTGHRGRPLREPGPEPLLLRPAAFRAILHRKRQLKALLMDQAVIAGLGNIYCDEALHAARLHPLIRSDHLDAERAGRLLRAIKSTLRRAIRYNGSTFMDYRRTDGRPGGFQQRHRVYQRDGQPCRTCGATIVRELIAGRSTFYCPNCQRLTNGASSTCGTDFSVDQSRHARVGPTFQSVIRKRPADGRRRRAKSAHGNAPA